MADPCGAQLTIQEPTASDNCDPNPVITYSAPNGTLSGPYPPGETKIEIRVTDASGNLTQDTLIITVIPFPNKSFVNIPADQVLTGCPQVAS